MGICHYLIGNPIGFQFQRIIGCTDRQLAL
jgi:hypothetical protein